MSSPCADVAAEHATARFIAATAADRLQLAWSPPPRIARLSQLVPIVGNAALMREVKRAMADSGLRMLEAFTFYLQPETDLDVMAEAMDYGAELGAGMHTALGVCTADWRRPRPGADDRHLRSVLRHRRAARTGGRD